MPRPTNTDPAAAALGAGLGALMGGPFGAALGGLMFGAAGTTKLPLEQALAARATQMGLVLSAARWIDRHHMDVVFRDAHGLFHLHHLSASADKIEFDAISDELYDQFERVVSGEGNGAR